MEYLSIFLQLEGFVYDIWIYYNSCKLFYPYWRKKFIESTNLEVAGCYSHMFSIERYT